VSVAIGMQYAMRMRHIVICELFRSKIFIHLIPINDTILETKIIENKTCVLIFSTFLSEAYLILRINEWDMIINVH